MSEVSTAPEVSIVIVNYGTWQDLGRCLLALAASDDAGEAETRAVCRLPSRFEVVVVDNSDHPDAEEHRRAFRARFPDADLLENPGNPGFAHGCNVGARFARSDNLLFLNPDVVAGADDVDALLQCKRSNPGYHLLAPAQRNARGRRMKSFDMFPTPLRSFGLVRSLLRILRPTRFPDAKAEHSAPLCCDWLTGAAVLVSRGDFEAIGGWCESYWLYYEDVDLCRTAANVGKNVVYEPSVVFEHSHGSASRSSPEVAAKTRTETIISRHVYGARHFRGARAVAFHVCSAGKWLPGLAVSSLLNRVTLGRVRALKLRAAMLVGLRDYYSGVVKERTWLSPRAPEYSGRARVSRSAC